MPVSTEQQIVNFRKMKQDFATQALRDGKALFEKNAVKQAKVVQFAPKVIKVQAQVAGAFSNEYTCELEIDRLESEVLDSSCDCPHTSDCQHLACMLFYLEGELENLLLGFSKTTKADKKEVNEEFDKVVQKIEKKVQVKKEKETEKQLFDEYVAASLLLSRSAFFVPEEELGKDQAELSFLFQPITGQGIWKTCDLQLVLRLPFRSKPFYISQPKQFLSSIQAQEPMMLGGKRLVFGVDSFGPFCEELMKIIRPHMHFVESKTEKGVKIAQVDREGVGELFAFAYDYVTGHPELKKDVGKGSFTLPLLFWESIEKPVEFSEGKAEFSFYLDYLKEPLPHMLLTPQLALQSEGLRDLKACCLFECSRPGCLVGSKYFRFNSQVVRQHIHELDSIQKMAVPEALFGCFIENALPELSRFARVDNTIILEDIVTYPSAGELRARCSLEYMNGELEADLKFVYGKTVIPESHSELTVEHIKSFITTEGILARNLVEESALVRDLFQGFIKDEKSQKYVAKTDRKIVEFMTEIIPKYQSRVSFSTPDNLQSQFAYDDTRFEIALSEGKSFDRVKLDFSVVGSLKGCIVDFLWDCVQCRRTFIVMNKKGGRFVKEEAHDETLALAQKILVLKLDPLAEALNVFDELEIRKLEDSSFDVPLWILVNLLPSRFEKGIISLKLTPRLKEIQEQIFNMEDVGVEPMPKTIQATFRSYQEEGIQWLSKLRAMGLNGILADDMGLGKTLQAITAITQYLESLGKGKALKGSPQKPALCLIVCPTSLVDNWKEEFHRFNPKLRVATCTGTPNERKKLLAQAENYDVLVTSYGLVQKDIELYESTPLGYMILDEAQYIKNRETRNARSVKKIGAVHKLILTGTPLENSLEDLWSLFDFLMPGVLGSFDRFVNTYLKSGSPQQTQQLEILKKKITPFVLRRMKQDVLNDLPPISHLVYHCHLSPTQQELYYSYAKTATEQLVKLVEKEGFEKVRLQVLATLTRLKQICCHPAIFAKENVESGDSAKYEMFLDLLGSLIEGKHKTVVFSQYTRMLAIMKQDLQKMGANICYLDGSSKNRLSIVKQFNEDPNVQIFLVSLKVGGTGLNLVGADTVIHYDMWWNPAVENQATDRVWRLGQKQPVSSYKLITLGTIEEKIVALQERKKDLLKEIVRTDEEVISKLTWEEVLELLKT